MSLLLFLASAACLYAPAAASNGGAEATAVAVVVAAARTNSPDQLAAANALISRVMGAAAAAKIEARLVAASPDSKHGFFTVGPSAAPGKDVVLSGTSGVEIASASQLTNASSKWRNILIRDCVFCYRIPAPLLLRAKHETRIQHKEVKPPLCLLFLFEGVESLRKPLAQHNVRLEHVRSRAGCRPCNRCNRCRC